MNKPEVKRSLSHVPFQYAGSHLIKIPVTVNGSIKTHFIFDTGIGVNLLSKKLGDQLNCKVTSSHTGKRMSGQSITVPLSKVSLLSVAGKERQQVTVGIWDMTSFLPNSPEFKDVEGFLSLNFFKDQAFTLDYSGSKLILETETSLEARAKQGTVIPITVKDDGQSVTIFMALKIPRGPAITVEIDLGGNILTLHEKYMSQLKVQPDSKDVRIEKRKDETGFNYTRYFTKIDGPIHPENAPSRKQEGLSVMFQKIIYDGLIGNAFMKRQTVTYDLANSRMIFGEAKSSN
ncbi:MAG: retropepsin-like aspartic protease [Planctomycetota bacterium]|nr:retropepsin-like aspartic protease [Planctomycetota bacterium]